MPAWESESAVMEIDHAISPYAEMVAYETLWALPNESLKTIADLVREHPGLLPTQLLKLRLDQTPLLPIKDLAEKVIGHLADKRRGSFSACVHGTYQYPQRLRDARHPLELFYYKGDIGLLESKCVSVVGARKSTPEGEKRAAKLAKGLVQHEYTIVSGLAAGIDTAAMTAAMDAGGNVIGVIGTPIDQYYPKENRALQDRVSGGYLLVSQVPFYRYATEPFVNHKNYFPQRNETMAALSEATVIVEASDTSGTLTQARACIQQGRKLFILNSCFENTDITWPAKYQAEGAIRVRDLEDIFRILGDSGKAEQRRAGDTASE